MKAKIQSKWFENANLQRQTVVHVPCTLHEGLQWGLNAKFTALCIPTGTEALFDQEAVKQYHTCTHSLLNVNPSTYINTYIYAYNEFKMNLKQHLV